MRLPLLSSILACALLIGGAAAAQEAPDGPMSAAGGKAGGVPTDAAPAPVAQTPPAARPEAQPLTDDLMAAADAGRRAPLLGEYHGEVGAMVGTGGMRGAYGHINAHPSDNVTLDLRFSTLHANGLVYGPGFYGSGLYGPGLYGQGAYGPAPYGADPMRSRLEPLSIEPLSPPPPAGN